MTSYTRFDDEIAPDEALIPTLSSDAHRFLSKSLLFRCIRALLQSHRVLFDQVCRRRVLSGHFCHAQGFGLLRREVLIFRRSY